MEVEQAWIDYKSSGDEASRQFLMEYYIPLVEKIAYSMSGRCH